MHHHYSKIFSWIVKLMFFVTLSYAAIDLPQNKPQSISPQQSLDRTTSLLITATAGENISTDDR